MYLMYQKLHLLRLYLNCHYCHLCRKYLKNQMRLRYPNMPIQLDHLSRHILRQNHLLVL